MELAFQKLRVLQLRVLPTATAHLPLQHHNVLTLKHYDTFATCRVIKGTGLVPDTGWFDWYVDLGPGA